MKKYKLSKNNIFAGIALLIGAASSALFGLYIGKIIDVISGESTQSFTKVLIQTTILLISNILFSIIGWSNAYASTCNKVALIKNLAYKHELLKQRSEETDISKFSSKIDLIYSDYIMDKWNIYENILIFLFSSIAIIYINWVMFLVSIVVSILPMFIPLFFKNYVQKATKGYTDESKNYLHTVEDMLDGRLEIIKYGAINTFIAKHMKYNTYLERNRYKSKVTNNRVQSITELIGNATFIIVFFVGGMLTSKGLMKVGGVIGVIQLMNNVVRPIILISQLMTEINACKPVLKELMEETKILLDNVTVSLPNKYVLHVNELLFHYPDSDKMIINNISGTFDEGKKYLIQGESGIGKSTYAKLLSGELLPCDGYIKLNDISISDLPQCVRNKIINYVDQKSYLFDDTILNNISLYRDIAKDKITACVHNLGLDVLDLNQKVNDNIGISGGQKTRICLARALVEVPKILIVDEPTAALDYENTLFVMNYLCSLPCTVIVISHNLEKEVVSKFDNIIKI